MEISKIVSGSITTIFGLVFSFNGIYCSVAEDFISFWSFLPMKIFETNLIFNFLTIFESLGMFFRVVYLYFLQIFSRNYFFISYFNDFQIKFFWWVAQYIHEWVHTAAPHFSIFYFQLLNLKLWARVLGKLVWNILERVCVWVVCYLFYLLNARFRFYFIETELVRTDFGHPFCHFLVLKKSCFMNGSNLGSLLSLIES